MRNLSESFFSPFEEQAVITTIEFNFTSLLVFKPSVVKIAVI